MSPLRGHDLKKLLLTLCSELWNLSRSLKFGLPLSLSLNFEEIWKFWTLDTCWEASEIRSLSQFPGTLIKVSIVIVATGAPRVSAWTENNPKRCLLKEQVWLTIALLRSYFLAEVTLEGLGLGPLSTWNMWFWWCVIFMSHWWFHAFVPCFWGCMYLEIILGFLVESPGCISVHFCSNAARRWCNVLP